MISEGKDNAKRYQPRPGYTVPLPKNRGAETGHGRVPLMVFRGEPFFGQDTFDHFFWTLQRNGLTKKKGHASLPTSSWTG